MTEALPLLKVNYLIITYPARPLLIRLLQSIPITFMTVEKKIQRYTHLNFGIFFKFICSTTASTDWKMEWKNMSSTFIDS